MSIKVKIAFLVVVILAIVGAYIIATSSQTVLSFEESFTLGANVENKGFGVSFLQNKVQVEVTVATGGALWRARILSGDNVIWEHAKAQGYQTTYQSEWVPLPSGQYTFTLETIGIGSLDAKIEVIAKGGFW